MAKNRKKFKTEKNVFLFYFKFFTKLYYFIKNYNLPISRPPKRTSKLLKKPSALKREHPALQNMKFLNFFSTFVGNFCPPGSGSESTDPIESGSNSDPDPQPCL
jgi:hypothetical protein